LWIGGCVYTDGDEIDEDRPRLWILVTQERARAPGGDNNVLTTSVVYAW
jgi:hypothetical protein